MPHANDPHHHHHHHHDIPRRLSERAAASRCSGRRHRRCGRSEASTRAALINQAISSTISSIPSQRVQPSPAASLPSRQMMQLGIRSCTLRLCNARCIGDGDARWWWGADGMSGMGRVGEFVGHAALLPMCCTIHKNSIRPTSRLQQRPCVLMTAPLALQLNDAFPSVKHPPQVRTQGYASNEVETQNVQTKETIR
ncbi:hypothetical protein CC80DRAFT_194519 [Byssothecium circinans]|uniref:Uncharacterized protein n=1 Tax=Byssothecium circinans TaxID=147558 RepID=A0A6A5U8V0_9PLEO|nr:hypothetical protein CC80DRAFT_194519 [Byssothecium circinans]